MKKEKPPDIKKAGYLGTPADLNLATAWNINAEEAARVKATVIAELNGAGTKVINPAA